MAPQHADSQDVGHPVRFELTQRFYFEAAHTLQRSYDADASRRIHGHTYHAAVTVSGPRNQETGMVADLALLRRAIEDVRTKLDHRLLDELTELGSPTMENLCIFILHAVTGGPWTVERVEVSRPASGDSCTLVA
jgi:6-pyruvoyltetrahydropterin/6-carboxytetrahydropterin synthase